MLDFTHLVEKQTTLSQLVEKLTLSDLTELTHEMIDTMLKLIEDAVDADVVFLPADPLANDHFASSPEETNMPWTLGHVIAHTTASAEESAFLAAELARGVAFHGRSRYEVPWQSMNKIIYCRNRLEESRRMRVATLQIWPTCPHLDDNDALPSDGLIKARIRFVKGLKHDTDHLPQIAEIVCQAKLARTA